MNHRVEFSPEALGDLIDIYDYIEARDGAERAIGYIDRIEECCRGLSVFPDRGTGRDDLRPGLRILGFERRAVIAFYVATDTVTILRILYGAPVSGSENTQRAGYFQPSAFRLDTSGSVVNQEPAGGKSQRQPDGGALAGIECLRFRQRLG